MKTSLRDRAADEAGSMFVVGAILLVVFALLGGAMLEVGQWFQHRRALQVRTDAAALAGGQLFNECFDTAKFSSTEAANDIEAMARNYGGFTSAASSGTGGGPYNPQFGNGTSSMWFQSSTYPSADGANARGLGNECDNLMLDVKMTQEGIPPFLSISPLATVHGWARIQLFPAESLQPSFPLAIPNFDLSHVGVTFVDETTGEELTGCGGAVVAGTTCTYAFPGPSASVTAPDGETLQQYTLPSTNVVLPTPSAGGDLIGVRISVGSQVGSCAAADGTAAYACMELGSTNGLLDIRDYPTPGTPTIPQLYEVYPSETCSPDSSPFFSDVTNATSCDVMLQARVDFGTGSTNPESGALGAGLQATLPDGTTITLHAMSGTDNARGWLWQGTGTIPVGSQSSRSEYPVTLNWTSTQKIHNSRSGSFGVVQRFTSANDADDGPVKMLSLSDPVVTSPYSETAGSHSIGVTVALANAGITNQLTTLRTSHNGSSTSWILCYVPPGTVNPSPYSPQQGNPGIENGMQYGCSFMYAINQALQCPDAGGAMPLPADCVPNKPSTDEGTAVKSALNARFGCDTTSPALNNWPDYSVSGDPRAVTMITTTYNAYANGGKNNGNQPYPVTGFAAFYITGFSGDDCPTRGVNQAPQPGLDDPAPGNKNAGNIMGYFIQYVPAGGNPDMQGTCVRGESGACIAVLTR